MVARLRGMFHSLKNPEAEPAPTSGDAEVLPTFDTPLAEAAGPAEPAESAPTGPPLAVPVTEPVPEMAETAASLPAPASPPLAVPAPEPVPVAVPLADGAPPPLPEPVAPAEPAEPEEAAVPAEAEVPSPPAAPPRPCPICAAPRTGTQAWCDSCGYLFPPEPPLQAAGAALPEATEAAAMNPGPRLKDRYQLGGLLSERNGLARYSGLDHGAGTPQPVPVIILRMEKPPVAVIEPTELEIEEGPAAGEGGADEVLPGFDQSPPVAGPATELLPSAPSWPSITWERNLLEIAQHPSLPAALDSFSEGEYEYLVEELPAGRGFWDAWDDPAAGAEQRFGWLAQIAEALFRLHQGAAILEGLRPDILVVTEDGRARLTDLSDLLPLPAPPGAPIRATLYTAPELAAGGAADARSDLYSFGALLYALHLGRELTEADFDKQGTPKLFALFPDIHPLFGRLLSKTLCKVVGLRFPSDEAAKEDPTGFTELVRTLEVCGRTLDEARLEIAAWTTIGMVRTGNEDAFALLHSVESRIDDVGEAALVFLCDGMGGYEAGEVAAAMAIQALRKNLLQHPLFRSLAGGPAFAAPVGPQARGPAGGAEDAPVPFDVETCKRLFKEALKDANTQVYQASRLPGGGRRPMGCTAEVVFVSGRHVVVGHVGDSRTYHLHEGRLVQMTRDQTLVNRLVELGTLTAEEAENHPRKNELQQAIGGQPNVEPGLYHGVMKPGDWVIVCSDGVTNHVKPEDLMAMLQTEAASADMAARRLVNFVNINGATDNATLVVIRGT
jgi:protein phosphatase